MTIKEQLKALPSCPGVYLMKGSDQNIIYVGKSKHLKNRVTTYFQTPDPDDKKALKLYHSIKSFDIITTDTELEALLLECKLIQKYRPWCNRLMKNPDAYVYIKITITEDYPDLFISRDKKDDGALYFGPYYSRNTTERALDVIRAIYKMPCTKNKWKVTSCMDYSLGKCNGVCIGKITKEQHGIYIQEIIDFLNGNTTTLLHGLEQKMLEASSSFEFEEAARLRDQMNSLSILSKHAELISFAESHPLLLVAETLSADCGSVLLLNGTRVVYHEKVDLNSKVQSANLINVASSLYEMLPNEPEVSPLTKHEIDKYRIVYNYLEGHRNGCRYYDLNKEQKNPLTVNEVFLVLSTLF